MRFDDPGRWVRGLHDLYLVTLAIAFVATAVSFPVGLDWAVTGVATAVIAGADLLVRGRGPALGYFLVVAATLGVLTSVYPMFATVGFGLLPLVFLRLPRWGAIVVGVAATGLPYVVQPLARSVLRGVGWQAEATIRFGPAYFVVVGVLLPVLTGLFTAGALQALRQHGVVERALLDQLAAARAESARAAGRAEERQRLAHELHDTLAQGMAGVVVHLEAAEQHLDESAAAVAVARARDTAKACLVDTRRAVAALRPAALDGSTLADALAGVCAQWTERTGVPARFAVRGTARRFAPEVEVVVLRVVQEGLANVGRHADAGEVAVRLRYDATTLGVEIRDDGRGFLPGPGGFGLATMRERAAASGGTLTVTSRPGAGTVVAAVLPDTTGRRR